MDEEYTTTTAEISRLHDYSVDKANILHAQFQQEFSCKEELDESQFKTRCNMSCQYKTAPAIDITEEGERKLLTGLIPHKASCPDSITPRILKELADEIAQIVQLVYKRSNDTGEGPSSWRTAYLCPVFKKRKKV
jgi:hypothetical protein